MLEKLASQLKKLISQEQYSNLVVAYSGGVDSQVLLDALVSLQSSLSLSNIQICHIHHGISEHANDWLSFAKSQAEKYQVDFLYKKVNLANSEQGGIEAKARELRYQALNELTDENSLILTGHHLDDQAETFLLAAKRGAGVTGLAAMSKQQSLYGRNVARPLLSITREEILAYAKNTKLDWVEDDSNQDSKYDRNFLRNHILNDLKARWPSINQTLARSAAFCGEAQDLLDELAETDFEHVALAADTLSVDILSELSQKRRKNLLRYFIYQHQNSAPSSAQLEQLLAQLKAEQDKMPEIKVGSHWLRRFHDQLIITREFSDISKWSASVDLSQESVLELSLPDGLGKLVFEKVHQADTLADELVFSLPNRPLTIQFSHNNPKVLPSYRQHSRPLKKVFQELAIAPWQRKRIPMIFIDDQLVCICGHFVCKDYLPTKDVILCKLKWYVN